MNDQANNSFDDMTTVTMTSGNAALAKENDLKLPSETDLSEREIIGTDWDKEAVHMPKIGDAASMYIGSDRFVGTIIEVSKSGKRVVWQENTTKPNEGHDMQYGGRQSFDYFTDSNAHTMAFSLRKNGDWRLMGEPARGGYGLVMGVRATYQDPSF